MALAGWGFGLALGIVAAGVFYDLHRPFENVCAREDAPDFRECLLRTRAPLSDTAGFAQRWQRRALDFAAPEPVDAARVVPRWQTEVYQRALRRTGLAAGVWTAFFIAALGVMDWVARGFEGERRSR